MRWPWRRKDEFDDVRKQLDDVKVKQAQRNHSAAFQAAAGCLALANNQQQHPVLGDVGQLDVGIYYTALCEPVACLMHFIDRQMAFSEVPRPVAQNRYNELATYFVEVLSIQIGEETSSSEDIEDTSELWEANEQAAYSLFIPLLISRTAEYRLIDGERFKGVCAAYAGNFSAHFHAIASFEQVYSFAQTEMPRMWQALSENTPTLFSHSE